MLGTFNRVNSVLDSIDEGDESILAIANVNADAALEFLVGNRRGGLGFFTEFITSPITTIPSTKNTLTIAPNPTADNLKINFSTAINADISLQIVNLLGQTVLQQTFWLNQGMELDLTELPSGSYFLRIETGEGIYTSKLIIEN